MKNVVVCIDEMRLQPGAGDDTNATRLFGLLDQSDNQTGWYHPGTPRRARQRDALADARITVGAAYAFLARNAAPDDRILVLGAGRGGYCAQALTRLLGTVGILPSPWDDLTDYVVSAYGLPRTQRTPQEWDRITQLATDLNDGEKTTVAVDYLGLWDALRPPTLPSPPSAPVSNVISGRHAMAVDGGPFSLRLVGMPADRVEQVWFRGGHCDVAGGARACGALAAITFDWILDGALAAGALLRADATAVAPTPSQTDALAGSARSMSLRHLPSDALVHASVDVYLRAHPEYWRRLPDRVVWSDQDWLARGERLVPAALAQAVPTEELTAVAS